MAESIYAQVPTFYQELAKREVAENPLHLQAHLTSLKRWLASTPHIQFPTDDVFLLCFLRYAHFEHSLAQKRIDNYATLRTNKKHGICEWFIYPPLTDPVVDRYLDMGIFTPLGATSSGVHIFLFKLSNWDVDALPQLEMRTMHNMNFERYLFNQCCQIGGCGFFIDISSLTSKQIAGWTDRRSMRNGTKLLQEASPGRTKHLIFYKEPAIFDAIFKIFEFWLSDKMRQRVLRLKDNIEKGFQKVPGLEDVMPAEYGGKNGPLAKLIEKNKQEFKEFYQKPSILSDVRVDEGKRPASTMNYIREYKDYCEDVMGKRGTYVQLESGD